MRAAFRLLEITAPSIGARWADRLWFTLPTIPAGESAPGGTPFEVTSGGSTVRGQRWGSGPVVYLVHGWGGNAAQFRALVAPLVTSGFTVVAHDAPSHGTSDAGAHGPTTSHAVEMGRALDAVVARQGPAHAVVAHSMGAPATGLALQHGWLGVERLVLIAPMVRLADHIPVLQEALGFGPRILTRIKRMAAARVGLEVDEVDLLRIAHEIERPALLVIHDRGDREARYDRSRQLIELWDGARLTTTEGLGHGRILRDTAVVRQVVAFVAAGKLDELDRTA